PLKVESIRNFGAEVHFVGKDFDESRKWVDEKAEEEGMHFLSAGDEPLLISGVGTYSLEIFEALPEVEAILAPIGGGSGVSGVCVVANTLNLRVQVFAVQSEAVPAAYLSWKEKRRVDSKMETFAEGLATRTAFDLPQEILRKHLDDFILVSEEELKRATLLAL